MNVIVLVLDCFSEPLVGDLLYRELLEDDEQFTIFNRCYTNSIWTPPTHTTLFSGLYPFEHQVLVGFEPSGVVVSDDYELLPETFAGEGYRTVGISQNPWVGKVTNLNRGFSLFVEADLELSKGSFLDYSFGLRSRLSKSIASWLSNLGKGSYVPYLMKSPQYTRELFNFLKYMASKISSQGQPFFLFANLMDLHQPYFPPSSLVNDSVFEQIRKNVLFRRFFHGNSVQDSEKARIKSALMRYYNASTRFLVKRIKIFIQNLKEKGLLDNTTLLITSDHGKPLRYRRSDLLHYFSLDNLHIPLVVRSPLFKEREFDDPVSLVDIYDFLEAIASGSSMGADKDIGIKPSSPHSDEDAVFVEGVIPFSGSKNTGGKEHSPVHLQGIVYKNKVILERDNSFLVLKSEVVADYPKSQFRFKDKFQSTLSTINAESLQQFETDGEEFEKSLEERLRQLGYME